MLRATPPHRMLATGVSFPANVHRFYFPCKDVRGWLRAMELRLGQEKGQRAHRTTGELGVKGGPPYIPYLEVWVITTPDN